MTIKIHNIHFIIEKEKQKCESDTKNFFRIFIHTQQFKGKNLTHFYKCFMWRTNGY